VLACGPGAALSHRAAAALWGLRPAWRDYREVSAARSVKRVRGVIVHRPRTIEWTVERGIPVTTVSRTLVDIADVVTPRVLRAVLEQTEFLRLDAAPVPIPGRRGHGRLLATLAELAPLVSMTRSELEARFLELCRRAGLPAPEVNTVIEGMEVDFAWPEARVAVETDGWEAHGTRTAFRRDRRRSAALALAGWTVLRFTYEDVVHDPGYVVATLRGLGLFVPR
jgi:very-short-patch-repair endonuclease